MSAENHRPPASEFSKQTKIEALKRANFTCERCGISKQRTPEGYLFIHHIVGVMIAFHYHPELSTDLISSLENAKVLCNKCHQIEDGLDHKNHLILAQSLLGLRLTE